MDQALVVGGLVRLWGTIVRGGCGYSTLHAGGSARKSVTFGEEGPLILELVTGDRITVERDSLDADNQRFDVGSKYSGPGRGLEEHTSGLQHTPRLPTNWMDIEVTLERARVTSGDRLFVLGTVVDLELTRHADSGGQAYRTGGSARVSRVIALAMASGREGERWLDERCREMQQNGGPLHRLPPWDPPPPKIWPWVVVVALIALAVTLLVMR